MRAAFHDQYGGPHVVRIEEVDKPVPTGDHVLVRVRAAAVNRADLDGLYPRWQFMRLFLGVRRPRYRELGIDLAGVIEAVGPEATRFKVGDRVFGELRGLSGGSFAEYAVAREGWLAPIPDDMAFETAAALPHSGILALQSLRLRDGRPLKAGQRLLVAGASGNVGPYAVQMAKVIGAHVTGVASGDKLDFVRSLGADEVVDYRTTDYTRPAEPYDWIIDVDAHHSMLRWRRALKPGGAYMALGGSAGWLLSGLVLTPAIRLAAGKRVGLMLWWKPGHPPDIERLLELVRSGKVKPQIDRRFSLDEVADALRWVDEGHARGKVLVIPR